MKKDLNKIEDAINMYKATVSPSKDAFLNLLNQMPEKKDNVSFAKVIRSPYMWRTLSNAMPLFVVALLLIPTANSYFEDPFYKEDKKVEAFEIWLDEIDYNKSLSDYKN